MTGTSCDACGQALSFGPTVATVSWGDDWTMDFRVVGGKEKAQLLLARGSALVLTGAARNRWLHGIAKRNSRSKVSEREETSEAEAVPDFPDCTAYR